MSMREHRHPVSSTRNLRPRNRHLNVDLNARPPTENREQGEIVRDVQSQIGPSVEQGSSNPPPPPIDLEALDDDVVISTPTAFAEAKSKVRRPRQRAIIVDVDLSYSEGQSSRAARNKRRNVNPITIDGDSYINLEGSDNSVRNNVKRAPPIVPTPPPKELTFTCPVCLSSIVEETSTKCGHIFCKNCIKSAIAAQHKCPTCRKKISMRDIIRVYLPQSN